MQFGIFGGVAIILFGWIDKKDRYADIGRFIFIALGLYALWILLSGQVHAPEVSGSELPKEARAIAFFKGMVICSGLAAISSVLKVLKIRHYRLVTLICIVFALFLFFTVYHLQQS